GRPADRVGETAAEIGLTYAALATYKNGRVQHPWMLALRVFGPVLGAASSSYDRIELDPLPSAGGAEGLISPGTVSETSSQFRDPKRIAVSSQDELHDLTGTPDPARANARIDDVPAGRRRLALDARDRGGRLLDPSNAYTPATSADAVTDLSLMVASDTKNRILLGTAPDKFSPNGAREAETAEAAQFEQARINPEPNPLE